MPAPSRCRRVIVAVVAFVAALIVGPTPQVSAHAAFLSSDPVDGQVFETAPDLASLQFSEPVLLGSSSLTLLELGKGTVWHLPLAATAGGRGVSAPLPQLDKGAYVLRFVVVDPADLHRTVGSVGFGVGVEAPASAAGGQVDASVLAMIARSVANSALLVAVGAGLLLLVAPAEQALRLVRLLRRACGVVVVGWLAGLVIEAAGIGLAVAQWPRLLVSSDPGKRVVLGIVVAAAVWWVARSVRHTAHVQAVARVLVGMVAVLVFVAAYGGHAAVGGNRAVGLLVRTVHLGAVGAWVGTVVLGWWYSRGGRGYGWAVTSRVAVIAAPVALASGLWSSGRTVSTVTALLSTNYGTAVAVKMVLALVAVATGGWAYVRVRRGGTPGVAFESVVLLAAAVTAAVLAGSSPAVGPQFTGSPAPVPQVITTDLLDLTVSATLTPARPGANLLQIEILNTRRPAPGPIEAATITIRRSTGAALVAHHVSRPDGMLEWSDVTFDAPGSYVLEVSVDRPALPVPLLSSDIVVQQAPVRQVPTRVTTARWWPIAGGAAALVLVGGVALLLADRRRRTR